MLLLLSIIWTAVGAMSVILTIGICKFVNNRKKINLLKDDILNLKDIMKKDK